MWSTHKSTFYLKNFKLNWVVFLSYETTLPIPFPNRKPNSLVSFPVFFLPYLYAFLCLLLFFFYLIIIRPSFLSILSNSTLKHLFEVFTRLLHFLFKCLLSCLSFYHHQSFLYHTSSHRHFLYPKSFKYTLLAMRQKGVLVTYYQFCIHSLLTKYCFPFNKILIRTLCVYYTDVPSSPSSEFILNQNIIHITPKTYVICYIHRQMFT